MNDFDHWIAGLQGKSAPISNLPPPPAYKEGHLIRNLVLECAQERQEKQWNKVLEEARHNGLLEINVPPSFIPIQPPLLPIPPSRLRNWVASNEPRFLWVASVAILMTTAAYLWISKTENTSPTNLSNPFSHEGLQNMRGGSQAVQFIRVPKGETPQTMIPKIEEIFNHYSIKYYDPFQTKDGRVQFIAMISYHSTVRKELEKIGIKIIIEKESKTDVDVFINFVLIPAL